MIGGVIMMLVVVWMYQAAVEGKKENTFLWVIIGALTFFIVQWLFVHLNVYILESIQDTQDAGMLDDRPLTSIKSDSIDGVSHAFRSKEYELRNELYYSIQSLILLIYLLNSNMLLNQKI